MTTNKWIISILVAIVVLAGLHWYLVSRPTAYFNQYGKDVVPVADSTSDAESAASTTSNADTSVAKDDIGQTTSTTNLKNFMHTVTIETSKGMIVFETYDADAPKTVENFLKLAGKGFYNGLIFHRVIQGFMIQGGDPTGTGTGGPGYQFADELNSSTPSYKAGYVKGTVAMANSGPNTNGSQFFIMQADVPLPHNYTIFGKVVKGLDVVDAIASVATNGNPPQGSDKPLTDVKMTKVTAVEK